MNMENERKSVTQTRVDLYRKALGQLREENEAKAKEAELTKEAEADSAKEQDERSERAQSTAHEDSDKA
jgi:NADH/NAD ratio-sensing transcriptional regulator Rex